MPDPIITKLLKDTVGLQEGGDIPPHDVLATYRNKQGQVVFALCRAGLVLPIREHWRFIDNADIKRVGLDILRVKFIPEGRELLLTLTSGELLAVLIDGERPGAWDIFPIYAFVRRRVHQRHAFGR